ncbi:MAG: hypothetical protein GKR87_01185 [Kiritimatiellae bacterium]|nr:hypothetical protein [Kiritimatiellia bacterium]
MKNWQETKIVFDKIQRLHEANKRAALAMVVSIQGSTCRRPGAKLLVEEDGTMIGNVSGGCLENDVQEVALEVFKKGKAQLVHYNTREEADKVWGMGLGCEGQVDILIQPVDQERNALWVASLQKHLIGDSPFALATLFNRDTYQAEMCIVDSNTAPKMGVQKSLGTDLTNEITDCLKKKVSSWFTLNEVHMFTEILTPPPSLIVCGAGNDAVPLVHYATDAGFRVFVVDHRSSNLTPDRFPDAVKWVHRHPEEGVDGLPVDANSYVVLKGHTFVHDNEWLHQFLSTDVRYIGLLGPRLRQEKILENIKENEKSKIYGPIGLDLGGEGHEQVALSIVSEILTIWAGRIPQHLRDRKKSIHDLGSGR